MNSIPLTLLIGHRGVGKTSLLKRIATYREKAALDSGVFLDLDTEIQRRTGHSLDEILTREGEDAFRQLEEKTLMELTTTLPPDSFIALGAGYAGQLPPEAHVLWVRRPNDSKGRIFLDRPRLNPQTTPLQEYLERFPAREKRYAQQATQTLLLREGPNGFDVGEFEFFTHPPFQRCGYLTLTAPTPIDLQLPFERLELRDDLLTDKDLGEIRTQVDAKYLLLSHRRSSHRRSTPRRSPSPAPTDSTTSSETHSKISEETDDTNDNNASDATPLTDWALELGPPAQPADILSGHTRHSGEDLPAFLHRLTAEGGTAQLKAAPQIHSFAELFSGHRWQQEQPQTRSFLPSSPEGRWKWYRQLMKGRMPINFFHTSQASAPDQPSLLEWLNTPLRPRHFAAVLGSPVDHSYTPVEQGVFFRPHYMPVFAIDIQSEEFTEALEVLKALGLKAAAVTSPLKSAAYRACTQLSATARRLQSVNTLFFADKDLHGHNTDLAGFSALVDDTWPGPVAIWGGGGTLPVLQELLPAALCFSARTGQPRPTENSNGPPKTSQKISTESFSPQTVIWAAPHQSLPSHWRPQQIVDLSYTDNSLAKEFALIHHCAYTSGLAMFKAQAQAQREHWAALLARDPSIHKTSPPSSEPP